MGKKGLGELFAQLVIDGSGTGRNSITPTIATEGAEEGAVSRAGVGAVETVDDVELFFEGLKSGNGVGENGFGKRAAINHVGGDAGLRIEALILEEKDNAFRASRRGAERGGRLPDLR